MDTPILEAHSAPSGPQPIKVHTAKGASDDWYISCECGWRTGHCIDKRAAWNSWERHATRIEQLMPADGWFAVYDTKDGSARDPLVGWALVSKWDPDDGQLSRDVVGLITMDDYVDLCSEVSNFERYEHHPTPA